MSRFWCLEEFETEIARDWSQRVVDQAEWQLKNPVGAGESGSFHVEHDNLRAFAKPAFQVGPQTPRAAHEKIAADLAFIVGVPVPPVVLWQAPDSKLFSISLSAFRQPITWQQAAQVRTDTFKRNVAYILAAGLVFHCWIGDSDHNNHPGNLIVNANCTESNPHIAFIDHAFSMTHSWTVVSGNVMRIAPYYFDGTASADNNDIIEAVRAIESLTEERITEIVSRIPALYLDETRANIIIDTLIQRRDDLARCFGV